MPHGTAFLIGQIKLTRIHVVSLLSPGYGSNKQSNHLFTMSKDPAASPSRRTVSCQTCSLVRRCSRQCWWSQTGSNRRPHACKARALPTELWPLPAPGLREACQSQIGLPHEAALQRSVVGPGRLELPTSRLSGVRSNHLSYGPSGSRQGASN